MRVKFCRGLTRTLEKREDTLIYCYYSGFIKLCSNWGLSGDKHRSTHKQWDGAGVSLMLLRHQNGILLLGKLNIYKDKDSKQLHPLSRCKFSLKEKITLISELQEPWGGCMGQNQNLVAPKKKKCPTHSMRCTNYNLYQGKAAHWGPSMITMNGSKLILSNIAIYQHSTA